MCQFEEIAKDYIALGKLKKYDPSAPMAEVGKVIVEEVRHKLTVIRNDKDKNKRYLGVPFTPRELLDEMVMRVYLNAPDNSKDKAILVIQCIEWIPMLLLSGYTNVSYMICVDEADTTETYNKLCALLLPLGIKNIIVVNTELQGTDMKKFKKQFDLVIGNPPFTFKSGESSNTTKLYDKISEMGFELVKDDGYVAMITPSVFTNTSSTFNTSIERNGVIIIKNLERTYFDIEMSCLYFICQKNKDKTNPKFVFISPDNTEQTKSKVKGCCSVMNTIDDNMSKRWNRGDNNRNKLNDGPHPIIEITGPGGTPAVVKLADKIDKLVGVNKIVMNNMGSLDSFGQIKLAPKEAGICFSVVGITFTDAENPQYIIEYLTGPIVSALIKKVKQNTPNSKTCFTFIPDFTFDKPITNEMIREKLKMDTDTFNSTFQ